MGTRSRNADLVADQQFLYAGWAVGIYARASDDPTQSRTSVNDQIDSGQSWIRRERATHFRTYCDNDLSGSRFATKARGDFDQLLADVEAGKLQMIWFWKLSRSQRQLGVFVKLRDACRRHDVRWIVDNRVYNLKDRGDRLALGVQALMDEDLPEQISENVRQAHASNAAKGLPHGATAYGWRRVYDKNTGRLEAQVLHEEQAAVLREIARRVVAGDTLYSIVKSLNDAGTPSPRGAQWRTCNIGILLRRPANIGKRSHHGMIVSDGIWPPILDEDTYYECRRILGAPGRRRHQLPTATKYLLSGIALCDVCGTILRAYPADGRMKYRCERPSKCVTIRLDWLDEYIEGLVLKRLARPDAIALMSRPSSAAATAAAEEEVSTLNRRMDEWYAAGRRGEANPVVVSNMVTQLMEDIEAAKARAAVQRVSPLLRDAARPDIARVWPDFLLHKKRAIIRELFLEIRVVPVGSGRGRTFEVSRVPIRWHHALPETT
jgi:site-specific DNA recombinase